MAKVRVAVIGATGYTGAETVRLLLGHPCVEVVSVTSDRKAGERLDVECPWLATDAVLEESGRALERQDVEYYLLCTENGRAAAIAPDLVPRARVIDLSADHRLKDAAAHAQFYTSSPGSVSDAVYGLPEVVDCEAIRAARLVANPGCHATAALRGLMPLVRAGVVSGTPVLDSITGASGAGRAPAEGFRFSELDSAVQSYAVVKHRHRPEIEALAGMPVRFTPHLAPMARGIELTAHVPLARAMDRQALGELYRGAYHGRAFVRVVDAPPSTKQVLGSNRCDVYADFDEHAGMAVVIAALDNLVKGAAGQAVQNLNLMAGLAEETGLPVSGVWP